MLETLENALLDSDASGLYASAPAKPFLRWAGGKNWLIKYLPKLISRDFNTYHEPFVGGGSVYFHLNPKTAYLSDANEELINAYIGIRDKVEEVIELISQWPVEEKQYYAVRSMHALSTVEKSARFIYLNRTSFNGIYRVNRKGEYNVPWGKKDSYKFDFNRIRNASVALQGANISCRSFEKTLENVNEDDLVFLDPPYTVSHNNNGFIEYNKKLFALEDQYMLRDYIKSIEQKNAYFILTNAAHQTVKDIFENTGTMFEVARHCGLGGRNAKRANISEYIFTNIPDVTLEGLI